MGYIAQTDSILDGIGTIAITVGNFGAGVNGWIHAVGIGATFGTQPITLGLVATMNPTLGGADTITTGVGQDIILGGLGADTITTGDGNKLILGDHGYIDWTAADAGRSYAVSSGDDTVAGDIDRIVSTDPDIGGNDIITTSGGDDIIIGGFGTDMINAGNGANLILGDNGQILAAGANTPNFGTQPITLGLVGTTNPTFGGNDTITTGSGRDIVLGGLGADTLTVNDGNNLVLGDQGYIDWTAGDAGRAYPISGGDDTVAGDIDRIVSTDAALGGNDTITTGAGDDIIVGGLGADQITAGNGNNLAFGDQGLILAAGENAPNFSTQPITLGLVTSTDSSSGGDDTITTGIGRDIVLGGLGGDSIVANFTENHSSGSTAATWDNNNIVFGDQGYIDWTAADAGRTYPSHKVGDDSSASDIDQIVSTNFELGGDDTITAGALDDILVGGAGLNVIISGAGINLVLNGISQLYAAALDAPNLGTQPVTLESIPVTFTRIWNFERFTSNRILDILSRASDHERDYTIAVVNAVYARLVKALHTGSSNHDALLTCGHFEDALHDAAHGVAVTAAPTAIVAADDVEPKAVAIDTQLTAPGPSIPVDANPPVVATITQAKEPQQAVTPAQAPVVAPVETEPTAAKTSRVRPGVVVAVVALIVLLAVFKRQALGKYLGQFVGKDKSAPKKGDSEK